MPIAGKGMLLTSMDIDEADEVDFNRWYDREHLEERVAIDGFIEARRYVALQGSPKYLCLYSTATIDVLDSRAYKARLASPTEWSKRTMARFKNMIRSVARITISRGNGRGAVLGIVRLRSSSAGEENLRRSLGDAFDLSSLDGVISMHLIESDAIVRTHEGNFIGGEFRRRRLVRADRCNGRKRGIGCDRRAFCAQRFVQIIDDFHRYLPSDVGSLEERYTGLAFRSDACCTAA
jgi:hypothetical protein